MSLLVREAPPEHYPWICNRLGLWPTAGFRALEAFEADGPIRGMVAYDHWAPNSVSVHIAIESAAALRAFVKGRAPAFHYPFIHSGRGVLLGTVRSDNEKALKLDRHLGFREVTRLKDAAEKGVDVVIMEMRRENCRWLGGTHG